MEPYEGSARCPTCGRLDDAAAVQPLFVVTAASAGGKSTVFPRVAQLLAGRCVTFDIDWLLDPAATLAGKRTIEELNWEAFRDVWLAVAHGVAQSGLPTVLFGPIIPPHLTNLPNRRWVGDLHFVLLDCPDEVRRERIDSRPAWRSRDIAAQIEFGCWMRTNIEDQIDTSAHSPQEVAEEVARRVLSRLSVG